MAKASLIGLITQGPELQHSAKGEPYARFSVAEYVGFGSQRHTQFVDVWAWGHMAQRLAKCSLDKGDFIFLMRHVGVGRIHEERRRHKG